MGASAKAVDFSGVKERGAFNPKRVAEGDYAAVITKVEDATVKDTTDDFMYVFTIKPKKFSQASYPYRCKLQENQLWKLRNIAVAAGVNVPKKRIKFDPNKLVGKTIGITLIDDEYQGREKSEIDAVFPVNELAEGAVDEDSSTTEDDFDETATPQLAGDDADDAGTEDEAEPAAEKPKKSKKDKGEKKKGKKKKGGDENVEDLDVSDL